MPDFSDVRVTVVGDVCEDVLIYGTASRMSRETPGLPVLDVAEEPFTIEGCASVAFRQIAAMGAEAFIVPTGRPARKTRLFASRDGTARELARWDTGWPNQDGETCAAMLREIPGDVLLYCQYRPGRPWGSILRLVSSYGSLRVGDVRDPADFVGILHAIKISADDAWECLTPPRPRRDPEGARLTALAMARTFGFRLVVVTMGAEGYAAATGETSFIGPALDGARRTSGAGDIFAAALTVALAAKYEIRDALDLASVTAGLAARKPEHLATVTREEIETWEQLSQEPPTST